MKQKQLYVTPTSDVVEVKMSGVLCESRYGSVGNPDDYNNAGDPFNPSSN